MAAEQRTVQTRERLRRLAERWRRSLLLVPACTVLLIAILGLCKVHGSSIGLVAKDYDASPQAAFDLRSLRSDEWHLRTPMVVRQADHGFPRTSDVGMGIHDVGVLLDFPVRSPAAIAKPQSWAYFVLDTERAFAIEWWFTVFGPFLGVYAALAVITRSVRVSALAGVLASAAPVMAWWTVPWLGLTVLYGGIMAAALVRGGQIRGVARYVLFGLGGWAAACCALELYPPWMIPVGLVFAALALSQLTRSFRSWRELLLGAAAFGGVLAAVAAVFVREHRVALEALLDSAYPGQRRVEAAGGSPYLMFSAPFDSLSVHGASTTVGGTNQSEAASGLMLWVPIGVVGGAFTAVRRSPTARALAATMGAALVLAAWALLPVPTALGRILGLTSVQGSRVVVGLTVAGALAAGLYAHRWRTEGDFRPSRQRIAIAVATFGFVSAWAAAHLDVDGQPTSRAAVVALVAIVSLAVALLLAGRAAVGMAIAAALLLFSTARVNPLQVGLASLRDNPMLQQVQRIDAAAGGARWASLDGDVVGFAVLAASGVTVSTGVDLYAVPDTWHLIDPTDRFEPAWNRFANVDLTIDNSRGVEVVSPQADLLVISTPSCDGALQALGIEYVTDTEAIDLPCLAEVESPSRAGERHVYRVEAS